MKKLILSAAAVFALTFANAQEEIKTDAGTFTKPTAGSILAEVNFSPSFDGNLFALPDTGFGVVGFKARKFTSETKAIRAIANLSFEDTGNDADETAFGIVAGLGIENHFAGSERFSPYWGYEAKVGYSSDVVKTTRLGVGAYAVAGFDYYVVPNVYLGLEMSYGISVNSIKPDGGDNTTRIGLAPSVNPVFRLGWKF